MRKAVWLLLVGLLALPSCKKEVITLLVSEVNSHTGLPLRSVTFATDSVGYAAGGDTYAKGIVLRTTNGGHTWSLPDSVAPKIIYSLRFFNAAEGVAAGGGSWVVATADSGKTFSGAETDYMDVQDIDYSPNRQNAVKAGIREYSLGYLTHSSNGGASWQRTDNQSPMRAVQFVGPNTVFACGYGVIYKSVNGGETFTPCDNVRGDYFTALHFLTEQTGYVAGFEGMILKTTNGGSSFKKVHPGNAPFGKRVHFEAIKFWDENTGYVVGENGLMYRTQNGGDSWQVVEPFTDVTLWDIHLFSPTAGIVVGNGGKIFLFKQ